jgi:hypothetical protein
MERGTSPFQTRECLKSWSLPELGTEYKDQGDKFPLDSPTIGKLLRCDITLRQDFRVTINLPGILLPLEKQTLPRSTWLSTSLFLGSVRVRRLSNVILKRAGLLGNGVREKAGHSLGVQLARTFAHAQCFSRPEVARSSGSRGLCAAGGEGCGSVVWRSRVSAERSRQGDTGDVREVLWEQNGWRGRSQPAESVWRRLGWQRCGSKVVPRGVCVCYVAAGTVTSCLMVYIHCMSDPVFSSWKSGGLPALFRLLLTIMGAW